MNANARVTCSAVVIFLLGTGASEATLLDRGGGLIYDDALNVTWLQDASYSATSGYSASGRLTWLDAKSWAAGLQYYDSVRAVVWDDWRLPTTVNAPSSQGWDTTGLSSELAYMYYVNLGYLANDSMDPSDPAPTSDQPNPFINLAYRGYWSETLSDNGGRAWALHFHFGLQALNGINDALRVWAVRDGDVGAVSVPEPGSLALFGASLLMLAVATRRHARGRPSARSSACGRCGPEPSSG